MNQQLIFNNDFSIAGNAAAISFSCLVAGLKVRCFIPIPSTLSAADFLQQVQADSFYWEDLAEAAIAADTYNSAGEIWLTGND
ncbi:hypothetical protein AEST_00020 [Alishewanella aestuarii B11]|uniref:DUF1488 domain-containing protein n=1 Tax=Alishewanella aestuarii B11 TaxID=1197174 RepID=J1QMX4_9ALTE|nr:DUF1488 family protein [Alishewanella aestuarii]EJI86961.1 hypothetical protein AEST_00020 [Alishewanella aestuarii B11]